MAEIGLRGVEKYFGSNYVIRQLDLEIANGDSQLTDFVFQHDYTPDKVGRDTLHHSNEHPSHILLPVVQG